MTSEKVDSPLVHSMCEEKGCEQTATRIIKNPTFTYIWVCEKCYKKYVS